MHYINTCFSFIQSLRDPTINSCNNPTTFISSIFNTTRTFLSLKMPRLFVRYGLKENKRSVQNVLKLALNSRKVYSNQMIHAKMSSDQDCFSIKKNQAYNHIHSYVASQNTLHIQMAQDWGRIVAKAINRIFFHVAPDKQLKREESSTIRSMKKRGWSTLLWFLHSNTLQVFCY